MSSGHSTRTGTQRTRRSRRTQAVTEGLTGGRHGTTKEETGGRPDPSREGGLGVLQSGSGTKGVSVLQQTSLDQDSEDP